MIQDILDTILSWLTGFWGFVTTSITEGVEIFYDSTAGNLTTIGILGLFGVGVGLVYMGLGFVSRFFKK